MTSRPGDIFSLPVHPAADLFPMLSPEELSDLARDIAEHGLHEPLWVYEDPERGWVLLDGRNRRAACEMASIMEPTWRRYEGDDPIGFALSQNVKRRHLTTGQRAALADEVLPLYEAEAAERRAANLRQNTEWADRPTRAEGRSADQAAERRAANLRQNTESADRPTSEEDAKPDPVADLPAGPERARDKAAAVAGTSGRAVARYKRVKQAAPDLAEKVKSGHIALDRAERIVRDREAERRKVEQAKAEAAAQAVSTLVDIRHGDFREVLADLENVDAIITDPPYPAEFLPLLADLAAWADKVLAEDGVLAVLIGQTHLPEVYRLLDGHRPYRWTGCYLTPGAGYVSHPRRVQSNWKPLIVYGGGPRFSDTFRTEGTDAGAKALHKWGQDYSAFHTIIERLTSRGQTVVDPFMGSGTTLLAAHALGRHAIGADVDPDSVATARERLT